jgi:hypothetical protein
MKNHDTGPELRTHLAAWLEQMPDECILALLEGAQTDALAQVQAMLAEVMVPPLLARTNAVLAAQVEQGAPAPDAATAAPAATPAAEIADEITRLRQRLAENETLLRQVRDATDADAGSANGQVSPPQDGDVPDPLPDTLPDMPPPTDGVGYYVYGIMQQQELPAMPPEGIDPPNPVYILAHDALQALVSRVPLAEFGQHVIEEHMQEAAWLEEKVYAHQSILAAAQTEAPVIPFKFGIIYHSEDRVRAVLAQYAASFAELLGYLAGKQEWGVKLYCDRRVLTQQMETESEQVRTLREEIAGTSSGRAYFLQKKMADVVAAEAERYRETLADQSHSRLGAVAVDAVRNPVQSRELTGKEGLMILNGAYLVEGDQIGAFASEVMALEKTYKGHGMHYELNGPWPPYNFARLSQEQGALFAHE